MTTYLCVGGPKAGQVIADSGRHFEARCDGLYHEAPGGTLCFKTGVYQRRSFILSTAKNPARRIVDCYIWEGIDDNEASKIIEATLE